jgi:hypothetical protein
MRASLSRETGHRVQDKVLHRFASACLHTVFTLYSLNIGAYVCHPNKDPRHAQPSHRV